MANTALHWTATPLRSIAASELGRSTALRAAERGGELSNEEFGAKPRRTPRSSGHRYAAAPALVGSAQAHFLAARVPLNSQPR